MMTTANKSKTKARRWYSYESAAQYLGLSVRQVKRARESGALGCTKLGGNRVYFSAAQLDAYVEACTVEPTR